MCPFFLPGLAKNICSELSLAFLGFALLLRKVRFTQDGLQDQESLHSFPRKLAEESWTDGCKCL